ncbi:hypothetical protein [Streptomyces kunmingensis]|uniref:hypothetical protein n=1 Tax=Streptomyces kunmingensis TaxID=68225 RepID=UPI0031E1F033
MAVTPVALGLAASTACADPRPPAAPAASHSKVAFATRTASVVTELSAQEVSLDDRATLQVKGRLVEGDTLLFPLSQQAVSVQISGEDSTLPQRCNTTTTREGRFSCTFNVAAHDTTSATVTFRGNALFAPGTATTRISDPHHHATSSAAVPPAAKTPPAPVPGTSVPAVAVPGSTTLPSSSRSAAGHTH